MRIAFINPPFKFAFSRASRWPEITKSGTIYYPLFLCYAAAVAEKAKNEIIVLDSIARKLDFDMTIQEVEKFKPDMIVCESSTPSIKNDVAFVERYKKDNPRVKTVLVGTHPSALPEETMKMSNSIDFLAVHEYDYTIIDLVMALDGHKKLSQVDGLVYRDNQRIIHNKNRAPMMELDEVPMVSEIFKRFLHIEDYRYALATHPMVQVLSSRGCPNQCTFCLYPQTLMGRAFRPRSAENFVRELVWISKNLRVKEIFVEDDTFTTDKERVLKICSLIKEHDLNIKWSANVRADVPYEVLQAMKEAGCRMVIVGYECLDGDTIIFLPDGTMKKISECHAPIMSVDFDNMNIANSTGTKVAKPGKFKMIKLETGTREIISSLTHRFFILTENGIEEKQAKDIDTSDYLATIKKIDIEGKHLLRKDVAEFLGYYTGDGTCDIEDKIKYKKKYRIRLSDEYHPILEYYQKIIRKEWGTVSGINKDKSKNSYTLTANSKRMAYWLKELGLKCYSNERTVPDIVCKCSSEELAGYLRGIFDAEGSVSLEPTTLALRFTSSSKDLITQIKWLLLRFGIESTKVKIQKNKIGVWYYILIKRRDSVELFEKYIGFNHHSKTEKLKKLIDILNKRPFRRDQSDVIPYQTLKTIVKELTVGKGYSSPYSKIRAKLAQRILGKHNISKKLLAEVLQELKKLGVERDYSHLKEHIKLLEDLIDSRIGWERVWKKTNTSTKNIYDFSVPKYNNYIANGFIVHNSGNQAILNNIRKGITIEMAEDFTSNAKKAGLKIFGCFMIGLPGETHDTIEETFKFAQRLSPDMVFFQQAVPFPGTEFYNYCKLNKYITANDWNEWLDKNGQLDCIVSYPDLSNKEICKIKDKLMIRFYTAPKHILHTITHNLNPSEMVRLGKAGKSFAKYLVKRRV